MKQMRWLLFLTAVLFLMVACGGGEAEPETAVSDTALPEDNILTTQTIEPFADRAES